MIDKRKPLGPRIDPQDWKTVGRDGLDRCEYHDFEPRMIAGVLQELAVLAEEEVERGRPAVGTSVRSLLREIETFVAGTPRGFDLWATETFQNTDMTFWKANHGKSNPPQRHRVVLECLYPTRDNLSVRVSPGCLSKIGTWTEAPEWSSKAVRYPSAGRIGSRPDTEILYLRNVGPLFSGNLGAATPYERRVRHVLSKAVCMTFWLAVHRLEGVFEVHLDAYVAALIRLDGDEPFLEASKPEMVGLELVDVLSEHRRDIAERLSTFAMETGVSAIDFWRIAEAAGSWDGASKALKQRRQGGSADLVPTMVREYRDFLKKASDYGVWKEPLHLDPEGMPRPMFEDD